MKPQKKTVFGPIKTDLNQGDPYIDIPVYKTVPVFVGNKQPIQGKVVNYYIRQPLIWKKP